MQKPEPAKIANDEIQAVERRLAELMCRLWHRTNPAERDLLRLTSRGTIKISGPTTVSDGMVSQTFTAG